MDAVVIAMVSSSVACGSVAPPPASAAVAAPVTSRPALRAHARLAYDHRDFPGCAALFEQARDLYGAACCRARAGEIDASFALLSRAIEAGLRTDDLAKEDDFIALHGDARWQHALDHQAAKAAEHARTLNAELTQLFHDDQADRDAGAYEKIDWSKVTPRDQARRKRVDEILATGGAKAADDYHHAAMVYQHGNAVDEIRRAHDLAVKAVELDPDHDDAKWLAAAAEDRTLSYQYKPQKWGTQYKKVDGKWIVWPVDPAISDDERARWNVQPLAAAQADVDRLNAAMNAAARPATAATAGKDQPPPPVRLPSPRRRPLAGRSARGAAHGRAFPRVRSAVG